MEFPYVIMDPAGNKTAFLLCRPPEEKKRIINDALLALGAEQVGMIETDTKLPRMEMMGGEFCGNASRSFAAYLSLRYPVKYGNNICISVSGCNTPLSITVLPEDDRGVQDATISMPLPKSIEEHTIDSIGDVSLVCFDGISHLILWNQTETEENLSLALQWLFDRGLGDCCGVLYVHGHEMVPVVWVREVSTLIHESSCASGSAAVAAALSEKSRADITDLHLLQPGGVLCTSAFRDSQNALCKILLGGPVRWISSGVLSL